MLSFDRETFTVTTWDCPGWRRPDPGRESQPFEGRAVQSNVLLVLFSTMTRVSVANSPKSSELGLICRPEEAESRILLDGSVGPSALQDGNALFTGALPSVARRSAPARNSQERPVLAPPLAPRNHALFVPYLWTTLIQARPVKAGRTQFPPVGQVSSTSDSLPAPGTTLSRMTTAVDSQARTNV